MAASFGPVIPDVDGWLQRLGMAGYAELFRRNDIGDILRGPTEGDLKGLGIA